MEKIDSKFQQDLEKAAEGVKFNILISFTDKTATILEELTKKFAKEGEPAGGRSTVVNQELTKLAGESQKTTRDFLNENFKGEVNSLWITNQLQVKGIDKKLILKLTKIDKISEIQNEDANISHILE